MTHHHDSEIAELEDKLAYLRKQRDADERARRDAFVPVWRHTIRPVEDRHHDLLDVNHGVVLYRLEGELVNRAEAEAAGARNQHTEGGMTYLFNTATGQFICDSGGGRVFLGFRREGGEAQVTAFERLAAFVTANPAGGDVTDIVTAYGREVGE